MTTEAEIPRPEIVPADRIFLSHVRRSDLPLYAQWFADLELTAYLGAVGVAFMPEHEEQWYNSVVESKSVTTFAIIVRKDQRVIGSVSLMKINERHGTAELGIAIGDKTAWNRGYGSEAVRLMTDYGLTFCGLHTIHLWHVAFNERGHRAYLKAGFKEAGRIREAYLFDGQRFDSVLMDCTRADLGPSKLRGILGQLPTED